MLQFEIRTESFMYTVGYYEVPNLVTPKTDILQIDQFIYYKLDKFNLFGGLIVIIDCPQAAINGEKCRERS